MKFLVSLCVLLAALTCAAQPTCAEELYMVRIPTDPTRINPADRQAADEVDAQMSQLVFGKGVAADSVTNADITLQCDRFTSVTVTRIDGSTTTEPKDAPVDFNKLNAFLAHHRQVHAAYLSCDKTR